MSFIHIPVHYFSYDILNENSMHGSMSAATVMFQLDHFSTVDPYVQCALNNFPFAKKSLNALLLAALWICEVVRSFHGRFDIFDLPLESF